ncbi:GNAT family N-acetyltransferase [Streptomyces catenulae]|uniref:GNAT family N-acetyltransferase n=1 Tax=Streptomyces catenulae TaxID=66875 RepID=A0ABV2Z7T5_9ACTN|nr:GNAT family N-acetyltransferase [Streptomyces catenulae]
MTEIRVLDERAAWERDFERRLRDTYLAARLGADAAQTRVGQVREREKAAEWTVAEIGHDGARIGYVAVGVTTEHGIAAGRIGDLWVDAVHAGQGHEQAARSWAEAWCAERGARRVNVRVAGPDGGLFADYPVEGQVRIRTFDGPQPSSDPVAARPMTTGEYPRWLAAEKDAYLYGIVRAGALTRDEALRKAEKDFAELLPQGLSTPGHAVLVLQVEGAPVGSAWLHHGHLPGVTYGFSLNVDDAQRGKGYGRGAMAVGEQATRAAGDTALMFTVWGGNEVAMNLYDSAGFRVLESSRSLPVSD